MRLQSVSWLSLQEVFNIVFTTHNCPMWVVPEVVIVDLCWNTPWRRLVRDLDYVCTEWISSNIIAQLQGKPRRVNQSLTESRRRKFRTSFATLPGEYPWAAVSDKRFLQVLFKTTWDRKSRTTETPGSVLKFIMPITAWIRENKSIDSIASFPAYILNTECASTWKEPKKGRLPCHFLQFWAGEWNTKAFLCFEVEEVFTVMTLQYLLCLAKLLLSHSLIKPFKGQILIPSHSSLPQSTRLERR